MTREIQLYNQIRKIVELDHRSNWDFQNIIENGIRVKNVSHAVAECVNMMLETIFEENNINHFFRPIECDIVTQAVYDSMLEIVDDMLVLISEE